MKNKIKCILVDDEPMARTILESYLAKIASIELVKSCKNVVEAFDVINSDTIDLIFLDINMPEISGLTLAKSISNQTKVIFTTAYREYAIDGFDLQAVDYLLKPISFERFLQAVQKFIDSNAIKDTQPTKKPSEEKNDFIFVRSDRKMVKIDFEAILFVESLSDYIKIHTSNKIIVTRETITNIEEKLPNSSFLRVHRSYIINISKIDSYTNEFIEIYKKALPISRTYKENVLKQLTEM